VAPAIVGQEDAKYQGTPKGQQQCDGCINFQPPNACKFVEGEVNPSSTCKSDTLSRAKGIYV
jgi:hypothetical protein